MANTASTNIHHQGLNVDQIQLEVIAADAAKARGTAMLKSKKIDGLRTGFTTGACSTAATYAAVLSLYDQANLIVDNQVEITLPNSTQVKFEVECLQQSPCGLHTASADKKIYVVVKDAGDDPDCTNGATLVAIVERTDNKEIEVCGGRGVAIVTKPGLGLEVGQPAINPVPKKSIIEVVQAVCGKSAGIRVTISVPGGTIMAQNTINERLGLLGGISILGTSGIVKPYSTAAFKYSIVQAIDVAETYGTQEIVVTTGGKSEAYAMKLLPSMPEHAFIQVGDYIGVALKRAAKLNLDCVHVVGMIGKLAKMADNRMQTHAAHSEVNMELLAELAASVGASDELVKQLQNANTGRDVLNQCAENGLIEFPKTVCLKASQCLAEHIQNRVVVKVCMLDFDGTVLGQAEN